VTGPAARKSDLGPRVVSAIVMLVVAGACFALGGWWLRGFVILVALVALWELIALIAKAGDTVIKRLFGMIAGAVYVAGATLFLVQSSKLTIIAVVGAVICVDVFAYGFGRTIGGPKIAPRISPSKTWAGLGGAMVGATLFFSLLTVAVGAWIVGHFSLRDANVFSPDLVPVLVPLGVATAIVAQAGDFLESWLKRKAGVKDSSHLIPGHGGVLDRVDGLLAVSFVAELIQISQSGFAV